MKVKIGPHIKAIAWDFDGTIIDSYKIVRAVLREVAAAEGLPEPTDDSILSNYHGSMQDCLHAALGGNLTQDEIDYYMDLFLTRQDRHYESASEHLIEDALVLLEKARQAGLEQVLVTNREHAQRLKASPHTIVQNSVLAQAIGMVLAGDEVTHRKPDARVLEGFLDMHELRPEEVLVIGDQFVDGLLALNLGTKAILVVRNGDTIPNLERMGEGWQDHVTLVRSLHEVEL